MLTKSNNSDVKRDWDAALGLTESLKAVICSSVSGQAVSGTMMLEWSS